MSIAHSRRRTLSRFHAAQDTNGRLQQSKLEIERLKEALENERQTLPLPSSEGHTDEEVRASVSQLFTWFSASAMLELNGRVEVSFFTAEVSRFRACAGSLVRCRTCMHSRNRPELETRPR